jgi:hypothetical protein
MFVRMQRIAETGDLVIQIIVDQDIENQQFNLDQLISELYAWGSDLWLVGGMRPHVVARAQPTYPSMSAAMVKT